MRKTLIALMVLLAMAANAKIVYVDNHDDFISPSPSNINYMKVDIDKDNTTDISFYITQTSVSCNSGQSTVSRPYLYCANGNADCKIIQKDCSRDTIDYKDPFVSTDYIISTGLFPNIVCSGKTSGSYKLAFRLSRKDISTGKNGFIYGYVDYSITASGDIVVHGWYLNDAFNQSIVANGAAKYPYNGCVYQDTVKTYVTIKDTVKTCIEVVKKTIYDTIKVTYHDTIHKVLYDTTKITYHDTITKTIYDTIKKYVTINDTIRKTIYNTVKLTVYDTVPVPISVQDTLLVQLDKKTGQRLRMWPNPASQTITLDLSSPEPATVLVIDQSGHTIADFFAQTQITTLDAGQWAQGTYTVTVTQGQASTTKHIQINR